MRSHAQVINCLCWIIGGVKKVALDPFVGYRAGGLRALVCGEEAATGSYPILSSYTGLLTAAVKVSEYFNMCFIVLIQPLHNYFTSQNEEILSAVIQCKFWFFYFFFQGCVSNGSVLGGVVFMGREVTGALLRWCYKDQQERETVLEKCLALLHHTLEASNMGQ